MCPVVHNSPFQVSEIPSLGSIIASMGTTLQGLSLRYVVVSHLHLNFYFDANNAQGAMPLNSNYPSNIYPLKKLQSTVSLLGHKKNQRKRHYESHHLTLGLLSLVLTPFPCNCGMWFSTTNNTQRLSKPGNPSATTCQCQLPGMYRNSRRVNA